MSTEGQHSHPSTSFKGQGAMELPPYLLNAWRLEHGAEAKAKKTEQLKGWTASSLAEAHVKYQLDKYYAAVHRVSALPNRSGNLPSLSTIAAAKTLDVLANSPDLPADVKTTAESLSSTTLKQLLHDPRIPYQVLRLFCATPQARAVADIDEAILRHERYVRSVPDIDRDGRCLVILEDLCRILCETPQGGSPMVFTRKIPPKGGLEVLDELRQRTITIHSTNASYSGAFDRITRGIMRGLDWNNILLAGGMALTTLLHTDDSHDDDRAIRNSDLDLYIYGLGPEEANRKAQEIHDTWVRNLPPTAGRRMVVKNAKTINFLTSYPNRRIQIVLKLLPSPTDVLLNFDLDACAIGFDGTQVLMLPRCARAIETGYSVFTMDLVWGHSLGDRRASQDFRVFKYAERGFGIRFLPSYARSLEEDCLESMVFPTSESATNGDEMNEDTTSIDGKGPAPSNWRQMERKPHGREPGLKTLKRIAYLGQDYVNRYYFGITPLAVSPARYRREAPGGGDLVTEDEEDWQRLWRQTELDQSGMKQVNGYLNAQGKSVDVPEIVLAHLDSSALHAGLPDGRRGLGTLEVFMRHCEAWRLHARGEAYLYTNKSASMVYDPQSYDDIPIYTWDETFNTDTLAHNIDACNDLIWLYVKDAICGKLAIPYRPGGYRNYSTRRIRRQVCGSDLATVQEKQITIPVVMPWSLENYLLATVPQHFPATPSHTDNFSPIIPVHDSAKYDQRNATIPSLRDTVAETGNLRYWVITNESMWAQQDRALDEFAELMWSMFYWFMQAMTSSPNDATSTRMNTDRKACTWSLARAFRRRIVLPEVLDNLDVGMKPGLPTLRETLLFRPWALTSPVSPDRDRVDEDGEAIPTGKHALFNEEAVLYPFPTELFWKDGDEGEWDGDGVPQWVDVD